MAIRSLAIDAHALAARIGGPVAVAGDPAYETELAGADQRPAVVVGATGAPDVVAGVRFARERGLPVAVRATGAARSTGPGLLLDTRRAGAVHVDAAGRTAWLEAGADWASVIAAAAPHGLAPPCGWAPGAGAIGDTIGGGLGPLGRSVGFAADHVRGIGLVTADAQRRQIGRDREPDLFWAVRGGGGNFGVITDVELALFPVAELYGGTLSFPAAATADVLLAFVECAENAPDELSLTVAIRSVPEAGRAPQPVRGRAVVQVRVAAHASSTVVEEVIRPLRSAAGAVLDTVRSMPFAAIGTIHSEPSRPPAHVRSLVLREFDAAAIRALLPHTRPAPPFAVELHHLGGALARQPEVANPIGHRSGAMNLVTAAPEPAGDRQRALIEALQPWGDGGALYSYLLGPQATPAEVRGAFGEADFARLRAAKATWDPENMFRGNANIEPLPTAAP